MDSIFSQASFGSSAIDIRYGATTEIVAPDLLTITTGAEVSSVFGLHVGAANVVNFYFIDTLSFCGGVFNTGFAGCGELPGNDFVVESSIAAGGFGAELLAHELGHNLGLGHQGGGNLMNSSLNGNTSLTAGQVANILASPLVQSDSSGFFININPILILAEAVSVPVPAPATALLMLLGLLVVRRRAA
ncbi:hypothetical protein BGP75_21905 [Motiliproteus sp. MSK22-1]|nr:hypothetical protein BGP75_21905 [Motiliproteus sp. MSK22-1]